MEPYTDVILEYQTRTPLQIVVNNFSRDYNLRIRLALILRNLISIVCLQYRDSVKIMKELLHQILRQHSKYNPRSLLAHVAALKLEIPIIFSQIHQIDVEEDLRLQLQPLLHHHHSQLDGYPLDDIYLRVNPLIL